MEKRSYETGVFGNLNQSEILISAWWPKIFLTNPSLFISSKLQLSLASRICFPLFSSKRFGPHHLHHQLQKASISKMKFFNWMQNKFNGGQENRKPNATVSTHHAKQEPRKEEFSDWPNGLLAIGTFGNTDLRDNQESEDVPNTQSSSPDLTEFTPEEVGKLQKELTKLLSKKPSQTADLPLDRFLNCPSSLEVDRRISNTHCSESSYDKEEDIDRTIRVILGRCNKVCMEKNNKAIGKKSVAFLLKKMFVCSSGFSPAPSLRDTLPESRMEKLLRAMLSKKMYPQNNTRSSSVKRIMEDKPMARKGKGKDEMNVKGNEGSTKWVKTDSDFIVLEI